MIRRPEFRGAFRHIFVRQLCADDGVDRHCHGVDRMRSCPHARQRQCDRGDQAGPLVLSLPPAGRRFRQRERLHERVRRHRESEELEQKNGAIVRRLVGYGRFVGAEATAALGQLYAVVRLYGNLFQPSFKLQEKTRIGARVIKGYHPPVPPAARVLTHPGVAEADKQQLQAMMEAADPVLLFAGIRAAQEELGRRVDRRGLNAKIEKPAVIDLQRFAANLKTAWKSGETRPTHRRPYRRTKPYPKETQHVRAVRGVDQGMARGRAGALGSKCVATPDKDRPAALQGK
ncbi:hypothetical protein LHFGNBLO_005952 (plasmid) [Mesorhizobium sp. AR10]|nr:hypothetical protein [Mesorhizobium sp. AR10]UVK35759.1 hypothetical protein LHFGNBLO_005952 [Mesorhizobium sp. AR10]